MIRGWEKQCVAGEVDVWPQLQQLTGDILWKAAFGGICDEAESAILLQQEQLGLANKILQLMYIPGWRLVEMNSANSLSRDLDLFK